MSNQRSGKWKSASISDGNGMKTVTFFKNAKNVLEEMGHDDAAFYFGQVEEHLREGKSLPSDEKSIGHILGVQMNFKYSRVERFNNPRVAKHFANSHGGKYVGYVKDATKFVVKRVSGSVTGTTQGCYIVVWEK